MKGKIKVGDKKFFQRIVMQEDLAQFESGGIVHPLYSTFALGRDAEWVCRLFVLEEKEEDEEGIGVSLDIQHVSPAPLGSQVEFEAELVEFTANLIVCIYQASVKGRVVAKGSQTQRILKRAKIQSIISNIE